MLTKRRAAAFYNPWKYEIDRIKKGDVVFLYQSAVGIVAVGRATGKIDTRPCGVGKRHEKDGEHSVKLTHFQMVEPPIPPAVISAVSQYVEGTGVVLRRTLVHLRPNAARRLYGLATTTNKAITSGQSAK